MQSQIQKWLSVAVFNCAAIEPVSPVPTQPESTSWLFYHWLTSYIYDPGNSRGLTGQYSVFLGWKIWKQDLLTSKHNFCQACFIKLGHKLNKTVNVQLLGQHSKSSVKVYCNDKRHSHYYHYTNTRHLPSSVICSGIWTCQWTPPSVIGMMAYISNL